MSEKIRPNPSGGWKFFCGSFAMSPDGTAGRTALHKNVTPNRSTVIRTQNNRGRHSAKRLTRHAPLSNIRGV